MKRRLFDEPGASSERARDLMNQQFRILMVEDVATDAELMLRELKRAGIDCDARRVEIAVEYRRELEGIQPPVILSAFFLPRLSCLVTLQSPNPPFPPIPLIFLC